MGRSHRGADEATGQSYYRHKVCVAAVVEVAKPALGVCLAVTHGTVRVALSRRRRGLHNGRSLPSCRRRQAPVRRRPPWLSLLQLTRRAAVCEVELLLRRCRSHRPRLHRHHRHPGRRRRYPRPPRRARGGHS
jgi:hypothetical protein